MKTNIEKTDTQLQADVLAELKYEPSVKVNDIGVSVKDGTVTLNGHATSYGEKQGAVRSAKRVAGVKAIADDIEVKLPFSLHRTDGEIATGAADQIELSVPACCLRLSRWMIPTKAVQVTVREGWITLEGQLEWGYQKNAAESAVRHLPGVKGVSNSISIKPTLTSAKLETDIKAAFERNALVDAKRIHAETSGKNVVLRGKVPNYAEREEAERVAWAAPGVHSVDNQLTVQWCGLAA